jgi:hypothetical protein
MRAFYGKIRPINGEVVAAFIGRIPELGNLTDIPKFGFHPGITLAQFLRFIPQGPTPNARQAQNIFAAWN